MRAAILLAVLGGLALAAGWAPAVARPAKVARELAACTSYGGWRHQAHAAGEAADNAGKPAKSAKAKTLAGADDADAPEKPHKAKKRARAEDGGEPEKPVKAKKRVRVEAGDEPAAGAATRLAAAEDADKAEKSDKPRKPCKTIPQGETVEVIDPDAGEGSATIQWRGKAWFVDANSFEALESDTDPPPLRGTGPSA